MPPKPATQQERSDHYGSQIDLSELPPDLALMRIENDNIQAMATARPRDLEKVKDDILEQLKIFPAMAKDLIYSKPVGKNDEGVQQFARNLSVRAAEMLAEAYGFNRIAAKTTIIDDNHAQVEATFVDYQRGRIWTESNPVGRIYKTRSGGTSIVPEDRFLNIVCKAERSKVIREAILRCVPPGLKQALFEAADKEMAKLLKPEHMTKIVASFASKGISVEQLERLIGRTQKQGWLAADRQRLAELWSAIEHEEATVEEIFGVSHSAAAANGNGNAAKPAATGAVTAADLTKPRGSAQQAAVGKTPAAKKTALPTAVETEEPEDTAEATDLEDADLAAADLEDAVPEAGEEAVEEVAEVDEYDQTAGEADDEAPPEWEMRLADELEACLGIRDSTAVGEKYCGANSPLSKSEKAIAAKMVADYQAKIRATRGGRGGKQGELLGG